MALDANFQQALFKMVAASGGKLRIVSGFRSVAEQQALWNNALKKYGSAAAARKYVAPPGKSNHNHGFAADIGGAPGVSKSEAYALIAQLAPKFGLHTPMSWEPWHVEPVGRRKGKTAGHTSTPDAYAQAAGEVQTDDGDGSTQRRSAAYQLNSLLNILASPDDTSTSVTEPVATLPADQPDTATEEVAV